MPGFLSVNFMPNAVYRPELCIRTTLEAAATYGFPTSKIIFEVTADVQRAEHYRRSLLVVKVRGLR